MMRCWAQKKANNNLLGRLFLARPSWKQSLKGIVFGAPPGGNNPSQGRYFWRALSGDGLPQGDHVATPPSGGPLGGFGSAPRRVGPLGGLFWVGIPRRCSREGVGSGSPGQGFFHPRTLFLAAPLHAVCGQPRVWCVRVPRGTVAT